MPGIHTEGSPIETLSPSAEFVVVKGDPNTEMDE
jgi:hypothetical protein